MTPIELVDGMVVNIQKIVKNFNLSTKIDGVNKAPTVYAGYLPLEDDDEDENLTPKDYPFIIVRFLMDTDGVEVDVNSTDTTNLRIIVGTYSEDQQNGWRDALNIATRIKIELKKKKIIGPFSLTGKIQTELFEDQSRPFWHVSMDLSFNIPQVQPDWSEIFDD
jgi:hypothetical protein